MINQRLPFTKLREKPSEALPSSLHRMCFFGQRWYSIDVRLFGETNGWKAFDFDVQYGKNMKTHNMKTPFWAYTTAAHFITIFDEFIQASNIISTNLWSQAFFFVPEYCEAMTDHCSCLFHREDGHVFHPSLKTPTKNFPSKKLRHEKIPFHQLQPANQLTNLKMFVSI